jgi:hypothetical protein
LCREDAPDAAANTRIEFAVANSSAPSAFAFGGRPRLRFAGPSTTVATLLSAAVCGVAAARATSNAAESEFVVSREWNHVVWSGESRQPPRAMIDNHEKKKKKKKRTHHSFFCLPVETFEIQIQVHSTRNDLRFKLYCMFKYLLRPSTEASGIRNFPFAHTAVFFFFFFSAHPTTKNTNFEFKSCRHNNNMAQQLSLIVTLENSDDMHTITVRASSTVARRHCHCRDSGTRSFLG